LYQTGYLLFIILIFLLENRKNKIKELMTILY